MFPLQRSNNLKQSGDNVWGLDSSEPFAYSEGDEAEEYLRACFDCAEDLSVNSVQLQANIKDWSSEYHLSPARANLIRSIRLEGKKNVLELGSGCGAVTRYLGEQGCTVEAVEGSSTRAELTRKRCKDLSNVHVVNANFNALTFPENQYDAVFLIGVLEYAAMFLPGTKNSRESLVDILRIVQKALKPEGIVVIAIENRMGLKYWIGAGEDHFGEPDIGLYGYPAANGIRTYDKREWKSIFSEAGTNSYTFVYPFPDYKLPRVLINEEFVSKDPHAYSLLNRVYSSDPLSGWQAGDDEFLRWKALHESGYLGEFANSFLIVASADEDAVGKAVPFDFAHFSSTARNIPFRTVTEKLKGNDRVCKKRIVSTPYEEAAPGAGVSLSVQDSSYLQGPLLSTEWILACCSKDAKTSFGNLLHAYWDFLVTTFNDAENRGALVDFLPSNMVVTGKVPSYEIIDLEWTFTKRFEADFILFRALLWFAYHNRFILSRFDKDRKWQTVGDFIQDSFALLNIPLQSRLDEYLILEDQFHAEVVFTQHSFAAENIYYAPLHADDVSKDVSHAIEKLPVAGSTLSSSELSQGEKRQPDYPSLGLQKIFLRAKRWYKKCRVYLNKSKRHHYRVLAHSGLFDVRYYKDNDPALESHFVDPLIHYLETGWQEGRSPNSLFDSGYYREMVPGCADTDPLLHYIEQGWREGLDPNPLFFTTWYAKEYPESVQQGKTPLGHYLNTDWREGTNPNPFFDTSFYLQHHKGKIPEGMNPLAHYFRFGFDEQFHPIPFFDIAYYLEDNPSVATQRIPLLYHYVRYGAGEGRSPNRFFEPIFYGEVNGIEGQKGWEVFADYVTRGCREHCRPNRLFDSLFYKEQYPGYSETHAHPLSHYQEIGILEGYYPCREVAELAGKPLISILTPVYNTDELLLRRCIHSVLYQAYPHWELCLVDDGSSASHVRKVLEEYGALDSRIKVRVAEANQGISLATNEAAALATGEYLGFLDHDDELTLNALYEVVRGINDHDPDVVYTDEDLINLESRHLDSFFKPDFNPELLLTHNYITHFLVTRRESFLQAGGLSSEYEGAQDFDLVLKLTEQTDNIVHIPLPLYHWRASDTSTSVNHAQKIYADSSGKKALEAAVKRRGINGAVEPGQWRFYYRVKRKIVGNPTVTIIVHMGENGSAPERWLARMERELLHKNIDLHMICPAIASESGSREISVSGVQARIWSRAANVSLASLFNHVADESEAEHLLFINHSLIPQKKEWLDALLEYSQEKTTGAVTGLVEHQGKQFSLDDEDLFSEKKAWFHFRQFFLEASRTMNNVYCAQNVLGVPADLFMVKRALFSEVGGFREDVFPDSFFDVDLSLTLLHKGHTNIFTPYCRMIGEDETIRPDISGDTEFKAFRQKWRDLLKRGDPYFNPGRMAAGKNISGEQWLAWYSGT